MTKVNKLNLSSDIGVSVIIPFYKGLNWLIEALESVFNQTYTNFEIIIVDDGSSEDISYLEKKYSSILFLKIENSGPGIARNRGIDLASGKYIAFLDSDDLWEPHKLAYQVAHMDSNNQMWSHSNYQRFWSDTKKTEDVKCDSMQGNIIPKMLLTCPIATPCVMIRRSILSDDIALRFLETTRIGEDSYFWFKIAQEYPLSFIDLNLTKVRMRGSNAASQAYLQLKSKSESFYKIKNLNSNDQNLFIYKLITFGYLMCKLGFKFVETTNLKLKNREYLAKVIYLIPYIYFKIISKIL